jgi:superfamily II DNA/RNA helicase
MFIKKLDLQLQESIRAAGFTEPTELEQICIPKIKSGLDQLCMAPDKSGKTTSIVVSVLQRLKSSSDDNPRAIILVPDVDRANEMKAAFDLLGEYTDLRVFTACEDGKIDDQKDKIYMGSDVVIGTPKRMNQIYSLYALNLTATKMFVIDDAGELIKSFNYPQIDRLSESLPKVQRVVFTTEITEWIERFANQFMNIQEVIEVEAKSEDPESSGI